MDGRYCWLAVPTVAILIAALAQDSDSNDELRQALHHKSEGRHAAAETAFRSVLSLQPHNVPAYTDLGRTLLTLDRTSEAMVAFESAATHGAELQQSMWPPRTARRRRLAAEFARKSFVHLAVSESGLQDESALPQTAGGEGRALLQRAIALAPSDGTAYAALGHAHWWEGAEARARSAMEFATALAPAHPGVMHAAALLHERSGNLTRARDSYALAAALAPSRLMYVAASVEFAGRHDPTPVFVQPSGDGTALQSPSPSPQPSRSRGASPRNPVALGLVTMVRQPLEMASWLRYHRDSVGVERFFVRVEGSPELAALFKRPPWAQLVHASFDDGPPDEAYKHAVEAEASRHKGGGATITVRQVAFVNVAIPLARAAGLSHLLFLDDDELLYCPNGVERLLADLAAAPADRPDCHLRNLEALMPSSSCASPFREASVFRHWPESYTSYSSGKSIARLDSPAIQGHSQHHFRTGDIGGVTGSPITHPIAPATAVVLHYESPTYAKWLSKFLDLAAASTDRYTSLDHVPFRFYTQSIRAARAILDARAAANAAAEAEAVAAAQALWDKHKRAPQGLPAASPNPRHLPDGLTLIDMSEGTSPAA